ncbi:serine/threonine-protein phosphatase 1 regulatory subunit 10-like [Poecile atricapillus]|uniref:serine/threonine-protein phosphatase 1 regulatory subunit 10-like n=1 Tax=Poecile atricapillus TaxID=48891 RepID=UPI0027398643|nr:serine/threonine-protein phosphatase 1 regulatory subunit 10-like [Poecile atricapillus]
MEPPRLPPPPRAGPAAPWAGGGPGGPGRAVRGGSGRVRRRGGNKRPGGDGRHRGARHGRTAGDPGLPGPGLPRGAAKRGACGGRGRLPRHRIATVWPQSPVGTETPVRGPAGVNATQGCLVSQRLPTAFECTLIQAEVTCWTGQYCRSICGTPALSKQGQLSFGKLTCST